MIRGGLLASLGMAAALAPLFSDIAARAGLQYPTPNGGVKTKKYILETTGSGVALFDFDNDGLLDIFVVSGDGAPSRLYHNLGNLRFNEVGVQLGLTHVGWGQGACAADINGDGFTDLFVTYWGISRLYRNAAGRKFEVLPWPQRDPHYSTGCVFLDYDRDGDLDLFVANYLRFDFASTPLPGANPYCFYKGLAVACGPRGLPFDHHRLYRNDGGSFTEVSNISGMAATAGCYGLGATAIDADQDGWPDIYVACDQTPSLLYMNQRDGTFREEGLLRGVALDENGKALSGMGAAVGDYNNDGYLDLFRTNFSDERVTLYRNRGDGTFDEATAEAGLAVNTRYVGWGAAFLDFDHDGWLDLVQVNGHVFPETGEYRQRAILYRNVGGRFVEAPAPPELHSSRGLGVGDLDNDGVLEVVINNQNERPSLWRFQRRPSGNWTMLEVPVGSLVTVTAAGRKQVNEARTGASYLSQHDPRLHFGLGGASKIDQIVIRPPTGVSRLVKDQPVNRLLSWRYLQTAGAAVPQLAPQPGVSRRH